MKNVNVQKATLLEIVQKNRDAHRTIFEEAVKGYRDEAIRLLEKHIERISKGKLGQVYISLPMPQDHTKDYDRVLRMIRLSVDPILMLDQNEFAQYVMDDWSWKREFLTTASTYNSSTAAAALESENDDESEPVVGVPVEA